MVNFLFNLIAGWILSLLFVYLYLWKARNLNWPKPGKNFGATYRTFNNQVYPPIFLIGAIIFYFVGVIGRGNVFGISFEKETFPSSGIEQFISTRLLIIFVAGGFYAFICAGVGSLYAEAIGTPIGKWTCAFLFGYAICVLFWVVTFTVGTRSPVLIASLIGFMVSYKLLKPRFISHKAD